MVERLVLVKLKDAFCGHDERDDVARHSRQALAAVPGVRAVRVATPADDACAESWDLCMVVQFDSLDFVAPYVSHPKHRAYVDEYLKPKIELIKAWNFDPLEAKG